jgi:hypothetical protein
VRSPTGGTDLLGVEDPRSSRLRKRLEMSACCFHAFYFAGEVAGRSNAKMCFQSFFMPITV